MTGPTARGKTIINIHNAPRILGDYAILINKPLDDIVDLFNLLVELEDKQNFVCVFNGDLFEIVLSATKEYIQFKRRYIGFCVDTIEMRDRTAVLPLSHQIVQEYRALRLQQSREGTQQ